MLNYNFGEERNTDQEFGFKCFLIKKKLKKKVIISFSLIFRISFLL